MSRVCLFVIVFSEGLRGKYPEKDSMDFISIHVFEMCLPSAGIAPGQYQQ